MRLAIPHRRLQTGVLSCWHGEIHSVYRRAAATIAVQIVGEGESWQEARLEHLQANFHIRIEIRRRSQPPISPLNMCYTPYGFKYIFIYSLI